LSLLQLIIKLISLNKLYIFIRFYNNKNNKIKIKNN